MNSRYSGFALMLMTVFATSAASSDIVEINSITLVNANNNKNFIDFECIDSPDAIICTLKETILEIDFNTQDTDVDLFFKTAELRNRLADELHSVSNERLELQQVHLCGLYSDALEDPREYARNLFRKAGWPDSEIEATIDLYARTVGDLANYCNREPIEFNREVLVGIYLELAVMQLIQSQNRCDNFVAFSIVELKKRNSGILGGQYWDGQSADFGPNTLFAQITVGSSSVNGTQVWNVKIDAAAPEGEGAISISDPDVSDFVFQHFTPAAYPKEFKAGEFDITQFCGQKQTKVLE